MKQADTVMLSYPFNIPMSPETLSNDLHWYENVTDPTGLAMTWAIFAIGWFNTGNFSIAATKFRRGFDPNVHPPFMVWTEALDGGCTPFLTGKLTPTLTLTLTLNLTLTLTLTITLTLTLTLGLGLGLRGSG